MMIRSFLPAFGVLLIAAASPVGCSDGTPSAHAGGSTGGGGTAKAKSWDIPASLPAGTITIDGSSTVFPITRAVKEAFEARFPNVGVQLTGTEPGDTPAGSGGGFRRFTNGELDIADASRKIKDKEIRRLAISGIEFIELPLAFDGISVILNSANDWCTSLTVAELKRIWEPGSSIHNWNQVRPTFPDLPILLFGPGTDSGTFDYFTSKICGKSRASRGDFGASEDDKVIVREVLASKGSLGFLGFAYVQAHPELKTVAIDNGNGPLAPTAETIASGAYTPLSRPLYMYVRKNSLAKPEVDAFVKFYLQNLEEFVRQVGYSPVAPDLQRVVKRRFIEQDTGAKD